MVQTIQHLTTKHHLGVFIDIDSLIGVYLNVRQHMSLFEMGSLVALCAALGFEYGFESKTAGGELWLALVLGISSGIGAYYCFYMTSQFLNKRILHDNGIHPKWWAQYCFTLLPFATWVGVFTAVFLAIKITLAVFHYVIA